MSEPIKTLHYDEYCNPRIYEFNVKNNESVSISNISKKSLNPATGERKYNDNILYSGESRVTKTSDGIFYSYNNRTTDYQYNSEKYIDDQLIYDFPIEKYNNNPDDFYEELYSQEGYRLTNEQGNRDLELNPDNYMINKKEYEILKEIINKNQEDGDNTLSQKDLNLFLKAWENGDKNLKELGITNIKFDGNAGIYNIEYTQDIIDSDSYNVETGNYKKIGTETKSLVFDFVLEGEKEKVEDYEVIGHNIRVAETEAIKKYAEKIENYKDPDIGFDWVTPLVNFVKRIFN